MNKRALVGCRGGEWGRSVGEAELEVIKLQKRDVKKLSE